MTAAVRTIRRLDERSEQKVVRGILIEKNVPLPVKNATRRTPAVEAMLTLEVGESFMHKGLSPTKAKEVKRSGRKFTTACVHKATKTYRTWRVK